MSDNGSGVAQINSAGQPVAGGTDITDTVHNALTADIATMLTNRICRDGQSTITANIAFNDKKITGLGAASALADATSILTIQNGIGVYVSGIAGTVDAIVLTPSPAITAYVAGQTFRFPIQGANTGAVTVAVSGLAAKSIAKNGNANLAAGDLPAGGGTAQITYNGASFDLMSIASDRDIPKSLIDAAGDLIYGTAADTAARLALGTARQALMVNAGATAPAWTNPLTMATPQASTSGTSIDFTSIPAGVRRVTVMFNEISTNGTSVMRVQLGDAGGVEITGYAGVVDSSNAIVNVWATASGIDLNTASVAAGLYSGVITLTLLNASTNVWVVEGMFARTDNAVIWRTTGRKATSAVLDRVRITTVNGTDTFDAGEINISFE